MNPKGNPATLGPRWQPGESGNPNGRPRGTGILHHASKILGETNGLAAEEIAKKLVSRAKRGNLKATAMLLDRLDGPVVQRVEVEMRVVHEIVEAFSIVLRAELDEATATRILTRTIELAESKRAEDRGLLGRGVEAAAAETPAPSEPIQG